MNSSSPSITVEEKQKLYLNITTAIKGAKTALVEEKQKLYLNNVTGYTAVRERRVEEKQKLYLNQGRKWTNGWLFVEEKQKLYLNWSGKCFWHKAKPLKRNKSCI